MKKGEDVFAVVKIYHLIIGLNKGGAETMLYNLLKYRRSFDLEHCVISLLGDGFYGPKIRNLGVEVISLDIRKNPIKTIWQCCREISHADVLSTWMYHANFLGFFIAKVVGCKKVIWNVRHSNLDPRLNKRVTLLICRLCGMFSKFVDKIAYNGNKSRNVHEAIGYDRSKSITLDNGCDTSVYVKSEGAREYLLQALGLKYCNAPIVLSVAKWNSQKDIPNLIKAVAKLKKENIAVKTVFCGGGLDAGNLDFLRIINENGLVFGEDVFGVGMRNDIPQIMSGCDLFVLHSAGEAFPNVLIQAMACECVCVSTDAGDARRILNRDDRVVETCNSDALAEKMKKVVLSKNVKNEGRENRARVEKEFSISAVVETYEKIWKEI